MDASVAHHATDVLCSRPIHPRSAITATNRCINYYCAVRVCARWNGVSSLACVQLGHRSISSLQLYTSEYVRRLHCQLHYCVSFRVVSFTNNDTRCCRIGLYSTMEMCENGFQYFQSNPFPFDHSHSAIPIFIIPEIYVFSNCFSFPYYFRKLIPIIVYHWNYLYFHFLFPWNCLHRNPMNILFPQGIPFT